MYILWLFDMSTTTPVQCQSTFYNLQLMLIFVCLIYQEVLSWCQVMWWLGIDSQVSACSGSKIDLQLILFLRSVFVCVCVSVVFCFCCSCSLVSHNTFCHFKILSVFLSQSCDDIWLTVLWQCLPWYRTSWRHLSIAQIMTVIQCMIVLDWWLMLFHIFLILTRLLCVVFK